MHANIHFCVSFFKKMMRIEPAPENPLLHSAEENGPSVPRRFISENSEENFGARLRRLRKAKGFTQVELAEAIGSSQRMITYYETADGLPAAPVVLKLAKVLGVSNEELLGIRDSRRAQRDSPENIRLWRRLKQVEKLSPAERRQVLQLIDALIERNALRKQRGA